MGTKPSGNSDSAGVERRHGMYWKPKCSVKETDILACYKIAPQAGVDREESTAPFLYRHHFGVFT